LLDHLDVLRIQLYPDRFTTQKMDTREELVSLLRARGVDLDLR